MIAAGLTFARLCYDIAPLIDEWCDEVVPQQVDLLSSNHYAPAYAWMFSFEKRLKYRIEDVLRRPFPITMERLLFGTDGLLSEALSNAFAHGHDRNPELAITVSCAVGRRGLAYSVSDLGDGFDVEQVVARVTSGGGYYRYAGNGLRVLSACDTVLASYSDGGKIVSMRLLW